MDKSEMYVNMCRKAKKVQEQWQPAEGDLISIGKNIEIVGNVSETYPDVINTTTNMKSILRAYNRKHDNLVWLPRQDQLQEMLTGNGLNGTYCSTISPQGNKHYKYGFTDIILVRCLLNKFTHWANEFQYTKYRDPLTTFDSIEQLWLAFVMYDKFKKKWDYDKKDWVI